jgi:hypothetical protein
MRPSILSSLMLCVAFGSADFAVTASLPAMGRAPRAGEGFAGLAPWIALAGAALATVLLCHDWRQRDEEWRAYTSVIQAVLAGFWAGLAANLLMVMTASLAPHNSLEYVMLGGLAPALALSAAAALNNLMLRTIALLALPPVCWGLVLLAGFLAPRNELLLAVAAFLPPALGVGLLGGIAKRNRGGLLLGLVGGLLGAVAAFFAFLTVDKTRMQDLPLWLLLHVPVAAAVAQLLIGSFLHFAKDPVAYESGKSGAEGAVVVKLGAGRGDGARPSEPAGQASPPPVSRGPAFRLNLQSVEPGDGPEAPCVLCVRVKAGEVRVADRLLLSRAEGEPEPTVIKVDPAEGQGPASERGQLLRLEVTGLKPRELRTGDVLVGLPREESDRATAAKPPASLPGTAS